jgi:hypothetical protein
MNLMRVPPAQNLLGERYAHNLFSGYRAVELKLDDDAVYCFNY